MATGGQEENGNAILREFEYWQASTSSEEIFLLECQYRETGRLVLSMLIGGEHEFQLLCPHNGPSPETHYTIEADGTVKQWANSLNQILQHDLEAPPSLSEVLNRAVSMYGNLPTPRILSKESTSPDEDFSMEEEEEEEEHEHLTLSDDDSAFTTEWELLVARKKKRWAQKELQIREDLQKVNKTASLVQDTLSGTDKDSGVQIFTSRAASGILTNDLIKIMENEQTVKFTAEPIEDSIYQWGVKLYGFDCGSELAADLAEVNTQFGYNYIELQLDFAVGLYPFYPPLVKVIRPRLQGSMMQRVTNMEMLKLSYWNFTKDMCSVLVDVKAFLQQWARLEVGSERNDRKRYPHGSYVDIEHHLLRLALVSEVNPRCNKRYQISGDKRLDPAPLLPPQSKKKRQEEFWAAGVGYGHSRRPEWDHNAYLAAQREKDKQIESVLHKILIELKRLYANHAPQLKPRRQQAACNSEENESVDPVEDMYHILEGSAIIPYIEQNFKADSFLEICRHTSVYKVTLDTVKEIAMQPRLLKLLSRLPDQEHSVYDLLHSLEEKASVLLQHICKAGNGSIPKPPKKSTSCCATVNKKGREKSLANDCAYPTNGEPQASSSEKTAEEKLARDFQVLFRDVKDAFSRIGMPPEPPGVEHNSHEPELMEIAFMTDETDTLESQYKKILRKIQFDSHDMEVEGMYAHNYSHEYKKQPPPQPAQVFRIAQDITSLSTSLPLALSSCICLRTDDDKLTLMRALITGPEGTPYSGGCFQFDIYFPSSYPKMAPSVNLQTTGGGTVRFNPNLYNCGKVCLSLLGTWEGQQGETWNETTSTILQVLVSIQSLILVPEPYFNEPGYEQEIGTEAGRRHSAEYNADVRINNIKYAMIAQLQNPSPGFEDLIRAHFHLKKDRLLQEIDGWLRGSKSSKLERAIQNLKKELNKLQPPAILRNSTPPNDLDEV